MQMADAYGDNAGLQEMAEELNPTIGYWDPLKLAEAEFWGQTNEATIGYEAFFWGRPVSQNGCLFSPLACISISKGLSMSIKVRVLVDFSVYSGFMSVC